MQLSRPPLINKPIGGAAGEIIDVFSSGFGGACA